MVNPDEEKKEPILISLISNLMGGEGHIIPYHYKVTEVTKILGWQHQVIYSPEKNLPPLPNHWLGCLQGNQLEEKTNLWMTFLNINIFAQTIKNFLQKKLKSTPENQPIIIFIERFIHLQLFALWLAILPLPKKNLYIWVLYRHNFHQHQTNFIYKLLNKLLKKAVTPSHFQLFSDSELLANSMKNYFEEEFIVMPIPHTELIEKNTNFNHNNIICWWAGPPRDEKGWEIIKKLTIYPFSDANKFSLVACESANLTPVTGGVKLITTQDNLPRAEYISWLQKTDIMLIPYDAIAYQERTSGVFTESIMAGNIPLTTANTWMAKELKKFALDKLIIDSWENPQEIWEKIEEIIKCEETIEKLKIMQKSYQNFHSINGFAFQWKQLVLTS